MSVRVDSLHTPAVLPQHIDPQIRNFLSQMTLELRGWSDEVTRALNAFLLAFPQTPTDPGAPVDGQVWYNTTTHEFKAYRNGAIVTFVVS